MINKKLHSSLIFIFIFSFLNIGGCGSSSDSGGESSGGGNMQTTTVAERFPIDGEVDFSELDNMNSKEVALVSLTEGKGLTTTIDWAYTNDNRNLYFAFMWDDETLDNEFDPNIGPMRFDGVSLQLDDNGNQKLDEGDDINTVAAANINSVFVDQHGPDQATDVIGDGFGKLSYDPVNKKYSAEIIVPIVDDINGNDATISDATTYNITIFESVEILVLAGSSGSVFPEGEWEKLNIENVSIQQPEIPNNLGGLIAFISEHEVGNNGEIYTFDPSTKEVKRITNSPDLFKDAVSISNDRTMAAFHGSSDESDIENYDIYIVDLKTGVIEQLTDNAPVLDGHPAWSPDDMEIAFATFSSAKAHIKIIDINGADVANLDNGFDDNDPDYLPDGRIVFKTEQFNKLPNVQIAVMNPNGTNVQQLSFIENVSDHDPVADLDLVLFERFQKDTNFATDPDIGFEFWDIIQIDINSKNEKTLVSDGWVNWLPVFSPDKKYIAHQKSSGYTDVRLIDLEGNDLGRLIPNITQIRYIDWK